MARVLEFLSVSLSKVPITVRAFLIAVTVLVANTLLAAEVYRQVNPDGTVSYSDRPSSDMAETITINTRASVPRPAPAADEPDTGPAAPAAEPEARQPSREEIAAERAANCAAARERNDRYQMSRRLYRSLPDGEREYLSDEELDAARAGAAADVEQWCN
jgi:hypothetical protein